MCFFRLLTVGSERLTTDGRMNVVHDEGGDVWVLTIQNTTHRDSGTYKCQVEKNFKYFFFILEFFALCFSVDQLFNLLSMQNLAK